MVESDQAAKRKPSIEIRGRPALNMASMAEIGGQLAPVPCFYKAINFNGLCLLK